MQAKFKTGTKSSTRKQYIDIWGRWVAFIAAAEEEALDCFSDEVYAKFLGEEHNAQISCSALRHIYDQHEFEKPPSLRDLEKKDLYTLAPKEVEVASGDEAAPRHPQLKVAAPLFLPAVGPNDVGEGDIVGVGSRLYRRTGSAWVELNKFGQTTGAVMTHPFIVKHTRHVFPAYTYEDTFASHIAHHLSVKSISMPVERALVTLACMAVGVHEGALLARFENPMEAAAWVVATLAEKNAEAIGAAPMTPASEQTASA